MADYAIGDVQGCYAALQRLLELIEFNENQDRLWFVGDLVNRGPNSLAVLRFVKALKPAPRVSLGNHDLHLLGSLFTSNPWVGSDDTISEIIHAPDAEELGDWLRKQSILHYSTELNTVMTHAGIPPFWDLDQAQHAALELETALAGSDYRAFLSHMYGNKPDVWSDDLEGFARLRLITNYFTRMRFFDAYGALNLSYKGTLDDAPKTLVPWYAYPKRKSIAPDVVFGHWAALQGRCPDPKLHALDTGYLWGGELTALRLQDKQRFAVGNLD